jgi:hypothetical protein
MTCAESNVRRSTVSRSQSLIHFAKKVQNGRSVENEDLRNLCSDNLEISEVQNGPWAAIRMTRRNCVPTKDAVFSNLRPTARGQEKHSRSSTKAHSSPRSHHQFSTPAANRTPLTTTSSPMPSTSAPNLHHLHSPREKISANSPSSPKKMNVPPAAAANTRQPFPGVPDSATPATTPLARRA